MKRQVSKMINSMVFVFLTTVVMACTAQLPTSFDVPETDSPNQSVPEENQPESVKPEKVDFTYLKKNLLEPACLRCHSGDKPKAGLDLSNYDEILQIEGMVEAGNPQGSLIYTQVASGEMPPRGILSSDKIEILKNWILDGALR